jgi:exopolysaccharide biosynthesis protein
MSLVELGDFLVSIGVYQGLNFDGGGSTTLVINGTLVNRPSDTTGERAVGNAIMVRERKR